MSLNIASRSISGVRDEDSSILTASPLVPLEWDTSRPTMGKRHGIILDGG